MARFAEAGETLAIAVICDGTAGRGSLTREEAVRVRREESTEAAHLIGASIYHLGYPDHQIPPGMAPCLQLLDVVRRVRPNLMLTHAPNDSYPDHQRTNDLVERLLHLIPDDALATEAKPAPQVPLVYYMDTVFGRGFRPTDFVDITDVFEMKRRMLACHRSQIALWDDDPVLDTMEMMEVCARFRGIQCNVRYAEGFRVEPRWDRTFHKRVLP